MPSPEKLQQLHGLIAGAVSRELPLNEFCEKFEKIYNLELDKGTVSPPELARLEALFNKVVWFSPFPEERKEIPNYLGEDDIRQALLTYSGDRESGGAPWATSR